MIGVFTLGGVIICSQAPWRALSGIGPGSTPEFAGRSGLRGIARDRLDIPKNALRWLVVLTPREAKPKIGPVMADYLKKKIPAKVPLDPNMHFPVFHYPIASGEVFGRN